MIPQSVPIQLAAVICRVTAAATDNHHAHGSLTFHKNTTRRCHIPRFGDCICLPKSTPLPPIDKLGV